MTISARARRSTPSRSRSASSAARLRTFAFVIEYDGTRYAGWQRQRRLSTVQAVVEKTLTSIVGGAPRVIASGRTDAGVHAEAQVAHTRVRTRLAPAQIGRAMNSRLPSDIAIRHVAEMPAGFHALRDARGKRYRYTIVNRPVRSPLAARAAAWVPYRLSLPRMRAAARYLVGRHDFRGFEGAARRAGNTVRRIESLAIRRHGDQVVIEVAADGFLYNMVRNIVGTLIEVGRGRFEPTRVGQVLVTRDRRLAGPTAPAHGLCLVAVSYRGAVGQLTRVG